MLYRASAAVFVTTLLACSLPAQAIVSTSDPSQWTANLLTSKTGLAANALDGEGLVSAFNGTSYTNCSGTLVGGGQYVVTAAHCVTNDDGSMKAQSVKLSFDDSKVGATVSSVSQISVYGGWSGLSTDLYSGDDLAVLRLDQVITSVPSYEIYTGNAMGQSVLLTGYGKVGVGDTGATTSSAAYVHWGFNEYESFTSKGGVVWDFDKADGSTNTLVKYGVNSSTGLGVMEANIASGDSGGGSFIVQGSTLYLAGVHSFSSTLGKVSGADVDGYLNSSYGELGGDSLLSGKQLSWLQSIISPVPEPGSWGLMALGLTGVAWRRRHGA